MTFPTSPVFLTPCLYTVLITQIFLWFVFIESSPTFHYLIIGQKQSPFFLSLIFLKGLIHSFHQNDFPNLHLWSKSLFLSVNSTAPLACHAAISNSEIANLSAALMAPHRKSVSICPLDIASGTFNRHLRLTHKIELDFHNPPEPQLAPLLVSLIQGGHYQSPSCSGQKPRYHAGLLRLTAQGDPSSRMPGQASQPELLSPGCGVRHPSTSDGRKGAFFIQMCGEGLLMQRQN